ncbi:heme ABC transporter permease [Nordella sp. HKS 07]|uniref:heme ABC transporter permease n=1 Tax=Nordella sp. HKS 07 TaxID=2712222 RepID=UPI0013E19F10|nr:heme ABC transporter permease [Nordella sp. HKS 07]QIG47628.1 heme ABC transporter permease [Nordella sp. HKS 07]
MQKFANPARFQKLAEALLPYVWGAMILAFAAGLYMSLVTAPPDYQQGETVRIMFVHVPAAWMALMVYTAMAAASAMAAVFRHPLADMAAKAAAPIGAMFCLLSLITGSLWGKPMWGAWWVWDARLTSMFVLLLLYLGYMAVWQAIEDPHRAALIARVVALAGFINVPIVKFSVDWWNSLHQGPSVFRMDGPTIDARMLWPLLVMALAYMLLFTGLLLVAMRSEIAQRKLRQLRLAGIEGR